MFVFGVVQSRDIRHVRPMTKHIFLTDHLESIHTIITGLFSETSSWVPVDESGWGLSLFQSQQHKQTP